LYNYRYVTIGCGFPKRPFLSVQHLG